MSKGIIYIAFGAEYDKLAANTISKSRQFTDLPITILTNISPDARSQVWKKVKDINFIFINKATDENREIKNQLYKYTPYDETLYIDCDSIIVKEGLEKIFDRFENTNLILQRCSTWTEYKRYYKIYREAMLSLRCIQPINIFIGGFIAFKKCDEVNEFFDTWHTHWKQLGSGRDMPALACTVQLTKIKHTTITKNIDKFFSFGMKSDAIVLHRVKSDDLFTHYQIPKYIANKQFDHVENYDWSLMYFKDEYNSIVKDTWIRKKFNKDNRLKEKNNYVKRYLPEIYKGGLSVLDIATGPGEFLGICKEYRCFPVGIEYPGETNYQVFGRLQHAENNYDVKYLDFNKVLSNEVTPFTNKFDIINCQHAINFIAEGCFEFTEENGVYTNKGKWYINEKLREFLDSFFQWCNVFLNHNGILFIASLHAINDIEYSKEFISIAKENGFYVMFTDNKLIHKMVKI